MALSLSRHVNVAFVACNRVSCLDWLGKASSYAEGVWSSTRTHIHILSLEMLRVKSDRLLFIVGALRHTLSQFIISRFLRSTPHTRLND